MLWVLILHINGEIYSLKSTPNDRFFEKLFMAILFILSVFARILLRDNRRRNNFCFDVWPAARTRALHLDYGMHMCTKTFFRLGNHSQCFSQARNKRSFRNCSPNCIIILCLTSFIDISSYNPKTYLFSILNFGYICSCFDFIATFCQDYYQTSHTSHIVCVNLNVSVGNYRLTSIPNDRFFDNIALLKLYCLPCYEVWT